MSKGFDYLHINIYDWWNINYLLKVQSNTEKTLFYYIPFPSINMQLKITLKGPTLKSTQDKILSSLKINAMIIFSIKDLNIESPFIIKLWYI